MAVYSLESSSWLVWLTLDVDEDSPTQLGTLLSYIPIAVVVGLLRR
jgi:hypothetical protein